MYLFIASGLLIVCGMVDATFYNPRSQAFNQLIERRQRSIGFPYPYGYHYNPIEPSIDDLDSTNEALDSRINANKPIYQHVKMSTHDVNSVPRTHSYQPKNSLYDSEYITVQDIPSLFPENSYDYKYLGSPLDKYLTRPSTTESDIAINLVAIRKTSVFGYGFPTYKSPYTSDSVWNFGTKIPNTIFEASQSVETDPETFKLSSPTVRVVKLLPETFEQEPTTTTTKTPYDFLFVKLLRENENDVKSSVKDESNYEITQETPTEDESNPITSKESRTMDQSNILELEENLTEDESNSITTEEIPTIDKSNYMVFKEYPTQHELGTTEETAYTEDKFNSLMFDSITTEDESNSATTEENQTDDDITILELEENLTEDESNSITTEETTYTEDKSNSLVLDFITTDEEPNSITTEDESKSTTSQETTTAASELNYAFDQNWYSESDEDIKLKIKKIINDYQKLREGYMKPELTTVDNIPANLSSEENTNQQFQPQLANGADVYDDY